MILLDRNIVIYLHTPLTGKVILNQLAGSLDTCNVIVAEVLGFNGLKYEDAQFFQNLLTSMQNHAFNEAVTEKAIELSRTTNIQLPDAIIAATAIVNNLVLWTHNMDDFKIIDGLDLYDPLANH